MCIDGDWWRAIDQSVQRALRTAERTPGDVWATCASGAPGHAGKAETAVLEQVAGGAVVLPLLPSLIGETHAASSAFQLAAVLSEAARSAQAAGRIAVITSTDPPTGAVATSVLGFAPRTEAIHAVNENLE
jgi:3-oxoacyl-[acyl-carrier-protein] synthase II